MKNVWTVSVSNDLIICYNHSTFLDLLLLPLLIFNALFLLIQITECLLLIHSKVGDKRLSCVSISFFVCVPILIQFYVIGVLESKTSLRKKERREVIHQSSILGRIKNTNAAEFVLNNFLSKFLA